MAHQRNSSPVLRGAYGAIAVAAFALVASGCSPAPEVEAAPTVLGNSSTSPTSTTPSPTSSTPLPTQSAPALAKKKSSQKKATPQRPPAPVKKAPKPVAAPVKPVTPAPAPVKPVAAPVKPVAAPVKPVAAPVKPVVVVLRPGNTGPEVRSLQARLRQIGWFEGDVSDRYGPMTTASVSGFQAKRGLTATGTLDETTWNRLLSMTRRPTSDELNNVKPKPKPTEATPPKKPNEPNGLVWDEDSRCLTGRVMCVSKSTSMLTWVVDGKAQYQVQVRFGSADLPTREGVFPVYRKARTLISNVDESEMPFSMFFSGGQAVHYSANFARVGYNGASHGCVNVRDWNTLARLYGEVNLGDRVVVHR